MNNNTTRSADNIIDALFNLVQEAEKEMIKQEEKRFTAYELSELDSPTEKITIRDYLQKFGIPGISCGIDELDKYVDKKKKKLESPAHFLCKKGSNHYVIAFSSIDEYLDYEIPRVLVKVSDKKINEMKAELCKKFDNYANEIKQNPPIMLRARKFATELFCAAVYGLTFGQVDYRVPPIDEIVDGNADRIVELSFEKLKKENGPHIANSVLGFYFFRKKDPVIEEKLIKNYF